MEFTPNVLYKSIVEDVSDIYIDLQPIPNVNNDLRIGQIFNDNIDDTFNNTISVSGNTIKLSNIDNYVPRDSMSNGQKYDEFHNIYFPLTQPGDYVWLDFNDNYSSDSSDNILKFMINDNDYSKVDLYEFSNNTYVKTQTFNDDERVDLSINNISRKFIISSLVLLGNPFTDTNGPQLESVFVQHTSSNILRLTFNEKLQDTTDRMIATGFNGFTVELNKIPVTLSQPTITDNILSFRISEYINFNDISGDIILPENLSIKYEPDGGEDIIKDIRGNATEQFKTTDITYSNILINISTNIRRPSIVQSIVKNDTPNIIEIEVDEPLNESFVNSVFNRFQIKFRVVNGGALSVATISNIVINNNKVFIYLNQNLTYNLYEIFYNYVISNNFSINDTTSIVSIYHDSEIQGTNSDPELGGILRYNVNNLILDPSDNTSPVVVLDNDVENPQILNTIRNAIVVDFDSELKIINKPPFETFIIKNYESGKTYTLSDISVTANRLILTLNTELTHLDTNIQISYDPSGANEEVKRNEDVYKIQDQNGNVVEAFGLPPSGKRIEDYALLVINNIDIPPDIIPPEIIKAEVLHQNKNIINLEFNEDIVVDPSASPVRFQVYITRQQLDINNVITYVNFVDKDSGDIITDGSTNKIQLIFQDNFKFADIIELQYQHLVNHVTGNIRDTADNLLPDIPDDSRLTVDNRIISSENFVFDLESMSVDVSFASMLGAYFNIESQRLIQQLDRLGDYQATINLTIDVRDVEDVFLFTPDNNYACDPSAWMSWSGRKLDVFGNTMASDGLKSCVDGDNTPYRSRQTGGGEYVRHLSSQITGGYGALDIFGNESELLQAVYDLSSQVHDNIKTVLSHPRCGSRENPITLDSSTFTGNDSEFVTDDTRKTLSYTLVSQMLLADSSSNRSNTRIQQLVQEHSNQEYNNGVTGSVLSKYGMISVNTVFMFSVPLDLVINSF